MQLKQGYNMLSLLVVVASALLADNVVYALVPSLSSGPSSFRLRTGAASTTSLNAIGVLAKQAKRSALKEYVSNGVEEEVMKVYKSMKEELSKIDNKIDLSTQSPGPLQQSLTKRKGTITVIAEYKRKKSEADSGFIHEMYDPELLSPMFREFGASAVAVMADQKMGGCDYSDIAAFCEEQRRARNEVPGPIPVINNDLIIDELQVARSVAYNCAACVIPLNIISAEECTTLLTACKMLNLEAIVAVSDREQAQLAINLGARMLSVVNVPGGVEEKVQVIQDLVVPEGQIVTKIASIMAKKDKQLQEVEEAWALRDKGFNAVWVGEVLYKSGVDFTEHPGAIIKAMKSKSSLKWASPKAYSGRGEGAREYLGDILM